MIPTVCIEEDCFEPVWTGSRCARHRSRKVRPPGRSRGPGWARVRRELLQACGADERGLGGRCAVCGRAGTILDPLQVDHVVPFSRGGTNAVENLRPVHRSENERLGRVLGGRVAHAKRRRRA